MEIIKGKIPQELQEKFNQVIEEEGEEAIPEILIEAIDLWLEKRKQEYYTNKREFYQSLINNNPERIIILDKITKQIVVKGEDIIELLEEAKKIRKGRQFEIVSRDYFPMKKGQLGSKTKIELTTEKKRICEKNL